MRSQDAGEGSGSEGQADEADDGDEAANMVGIRKSSRTEQIDFKAREEERYAAHASPP